MKFFLMFVLLLATAVQAEVYKSVGPEGEVGYSDLPSAGAQPMRVPKPQTYTPPPLPEFTLAPEPPEDKSDYKSFVIDSPQNDTTVRDSLGNVELLVTLEPGLIAKYGHRIEYYLDGKPHGRRTLDSRKIYTGLDRGKHSLSAAVVNGKGALIISATPVTVHLHRISIQNPNHPINQPPPPPPSTP